jgi:isocitrate dehydrogenase
VQKHYYKHLKGEKTSTNSVALIFAWSGALRKRGELDNTPELGVFADKLDVAALETIEDGIMTGDLAKLAEPAAKEVVNTEEFLDEVARRMEE